MNFISLQLDYWDNPWQNRHAFVWELSNAHRVFFLSPPYNIAQVLDRSVRRRTAMPSGLKELKSNLFSYIPPRYLPQNYRFARIDQVIRSVREARIQSLLHRLGFDETVLIVWHPDLVDMVGIFDEQIVVYYKYDHYSGYSGGGAVSDPHEERLIKMADLMFVTSQGLYDMHKADKADLYLLPNGVDFDYFYSFSQSTENEPSDLLDIPRPRIGYVGVINEKVDFRLLSFMCDQRPDYSIVLVGPEKVRSPEHKTTLEALQRRKNVYFLGQKQGREVPAYIKALDVCMMCYLVNEWTFYGYPLKMHEYLACGKPTVSADLPAVREFSDVVHIPRDRDEWVATIDRCLQNASDTDEISRRLTVARNNSWRARTQTMVTLIEEYLRRSGRNVQ